ncbi:MAG: hypothetical protein IKN25_07280, partial [Spirochaetales bacterium]|nr:hypothetical protein [Spirochaetales bacterium]
MKIIFCGPPHSGKTVLIDCLRKLMPSDGFYTVRVHKDGEGAWSNNPNQEMTQIVRKKQDYGIEFINQKCKELQKYNSFPIVIVDIGGKLDDDKAPIFEACDAFVIISNDGEMSKHWLAFGTKHNCRCIADLYSVEHGDGELFGFEPFLMGRVANLIRGQKVPQQEVVTVLADIIIKESGYVPDYQLAPGVIDFNKIAVDMGQALPRTTRFQQTVYYADYPAKCAQRVYQYLQEHYPNNDDYSIYGARTNWLSAMTACMYYRENGKLNVYDMNTLKYIPIHTLPQSHLPCNDDISYTVIESDNTVFIDISIAKSEFSDTEDYPKCVLPAISPNKELFISGGIPLWFLD